MSPKTGYQKQRKVSAGKKIENGAYVVPNCEDNQQYRVFSHNELWSEINSSTSVDEVGKSSEERNLSSSSGSGSSSSSESSGEKNGSTKSGTKAFKLRSRAFRNAMTRGVKTNVITNPEIDQEQKANEEVDKTPKEMSQKRRKQQYKHKPNVKAKRHCLADKFKGDSPIPQPFYINLGTEAIKYKDEAEVESSDSDV